MGYMQFPEAFIQMTSIPGINDGVSETLGIIVELNITSQITNFIEQILSLLACSEALLCRLRMKCLFTCGRWLDLKLRYQPMLVGLMYFCCQCCLFPDDQNITEKEWHCLFLLP
jgi:hypothetical protein